MNNGLGVREIKFLLSNVAQNFAMPKEVIEDLHIEQYQDIYMATLITTVRRLLAFVPGEEKILIPADWWQHFKLRWFPEWAKKKWPVRMRTLEARMYFPHLTPPKHYLFDKRIAKFEESEL